MGLRKILTDKEPALHKVCKSVTEFDSKLHKLLDDMADTLVESGGVGLAAPQVGILRRIVVIEVEPGEVIELINPKIIAFSGEQDGQEGCLSVPGRWGMVKRPMHVTVRALNRKGEEFEITGHELLARCFCHELDHLDGALYIDKAYSMDDEDE